MNKHNVEEKPENSEEKNNDNQTGSIILGLNVHCPACEKKILKSIRGFDGVEGIQIDSKNNKVTIKGEKTDPIKIAKRIKNKTGKHVEFISPKNPKKEEIKKKEEKKKEPPVVEVVLKIYLYCETCAKEVKKAIHMMPGVQTVQPDLEKNLVSVKGAIEPEKLVKFVKEKTGKFAEIVKKGGNQEQKKKDDVEKDKKQGDQIQNLTNNDFYSNYTPQLFSDENPNACSIM